MWQLDITAVRFVSRVMIEMWVNTVWPGETVQQSKICGSQVLEKLPQCLTCSSEHWNWPSSGELWEPLKSICPLTMFASLNQFHLPATCNICNSSILQCYHLMTFSDQQMKRFFLGHDGFSVSQFVLASDLLKNSVQKYIEHDLCLLNLTTWSPLNIFVSLHIFLRSIRSWTLLWHWSKSLYSQI